MRLNIFKIEKSEVSGLRDALASQGLTRTSEVRQGAWIGDFYFSEDPTGAPVAWVRFFSDYTGVDEARNFNYYGAMVLETGKSAYAISFGKSHFYIRPFCDYDFGIELAKRIADEEDISQTSGRRFQGREKKGIRSFTDHTRLIVPPGESVDFIQAKIDVANRKTYGSSAKFGVSAQLSPDVEFDQIGDFLSNVDDALGKPERFKLPRTVKLSDADEIAKLDEELVDELTAPKGLSEIASDTFDLFGVDFIFGSEGKFRLRCGHYAPRDVERLTMAEVKSYLAEKKVPREKVLSLKVHRTTDEGNTFSQDIKEAVDFISDSERVVLVGGNWFRFNQDYLEFLNEAVRRIEVEPTEPHLLEISAQEGTFNSDMSAHGYEVADKNFGVAQLQGGPPVEAWDLRKGSTVYAVKFGTAQKLGYVVDQALNLLELLHNRATVEAIPDFDTYCLWLGYRGTKLPNNIADSGSIILKQKLEAWSRRCIELGIEPRIKLSLKTHTSEPEAK